MNPCPFCGSADVIEQRVPFGRGQRHVLCRHCFASGPPCRELADALDGWNRALRVPSGPIRERGVPLKNSAGY
jgi:Lar family restriction alleviation protein